MSTEPIVCRSTFWYHWRRIAMILLVFGFSVAFFYDWKIRYPKHQKAQAAKKQLIDEKGDKEGTVAYEKMAPEHDWPESPDMHKDYDYSIKEQLIFGILTAVGSAIMIYFFVRTVRGRLSSDESSFSTPDGQHVPFASAFRIDRRKWKHKGLAYVYYNDPAGKERRAVIDDLIFGGADKVLERLVANFKGEIIDLAEPEEEKKDEEAGKDTGTGGENGEEKAERGEPAAAAATAAAAPGEREND